MKKSVLFICIGLLVVASMAQATVISISAPAVDTIFTTTGLVSGSIGTLIMAAETGGVTVKTDGLSTPYGNGMFDFGTNLMSISSVPGAVIGHFTGGSFHYYASSSSSSLLLSGNIVSLDLSANSYLPEMLSGYGSFAVTGGSLQTSFSTTGEIIDITFSIPVTFTNFSTPFSHVSSEVRVQSIPEPATIALLIPAILALRKRNKK